MPISDEVIELAPVKKTKKTLIIMIACMGVLLAVAVAFLVMYLLKPSVTEDKNHVKSISVNTTELFSEAVEGQEVLYASIGNEYTVYSTVTVDNNTSTNISWEYPRDLIEIKEKKDDGEAYLKFTPRAGTNGKVVNIKARAAAKVEESQTITFTIVNQGAEDIEVKSYGVTGNYTTVTGDNYQKELEITVAYYTMTQSSNNKTVRVNFEQHGKKHQTTSGEYSKLTAIDSEVDGYKTNDVSVTSSDPSVIEIVSVSDSSFGFDVKQSSTKVVEIRLSANVYNDKDCKVITKVIKVKVEPNTTLGYVDSMYVFNKPVVNAEFIKGMLDNQNNSLIATKNIYDKLKEDSTLKVYGKDRGFLSSSDFAIVMPYGRNVGYADIFKHVMINPASIQYSGNEIKERWFKDKITVTSSNETVLKVTTDANGNVSLIPNSVAGSDGGKALCELTFTDTQKGSAGASITVAVRIIAQNTGLSMNVVNSAGETLADSKGNTLAEPLDVAAATKANYTVNVVYTLGIPGSVEAPQTLLESHCLNSAYTLKYDEDEIGVSLKGSNIEKFKPDTQYNADAFTFNRIGNPTAITPWTATLTFTVTVKKSTDGKAMFRFIKKGSMLSGADTGTGLAAFDKSFDVAVAFEITERATEAYIVDISDAAKKKEILDIVTEDNKYAGDFVRDTDTTASIYVQNRSGETLSMVSPENIKQFVGANSQHFKINTSKMSVNPKSNVFTYSEQTKTLTFRGTSSVSGQLGATIDFVVTDVGGTEIATLHLNINVINAVVSVTPPTKKTSKYNNKNKIGTISVANSEIEVEYRFGNIKSDLTYTDVNLYYGNNVMFGGAGKSKNGSIYTFSHEGTPLYSYNIDAGTLTTLTDIYAYSYNSGVDFSRVKLEFLLDEKAYWLGKAYGTPFTYNSMICEFERQADDVALFTDSAYLNAIKTNTQHEFFDSINQEEEGWLYVSAVVNLGKDSANKDILVYTENKSDANAGLALVEKAYFTVPSDIIIIYGTSAAGIARGYYSVNYKAPKLQSEEPESKSFNVTYAGTTRPFYLTVTNAKRAVQSVEFFYVTTDENQKTTKKSIPNNLLTFGGFANGNAYEHTISIKVNYVTYESRHTQFEKVIINFPEYLTLNGNTTCSILPSANVNAINDYEVTYNIKLVEKTDKFAKGSIRATLEGKQSEGAVASCDVEVCAGLQLIKVQNGEKEVSIIAGESGKNTLVHTFNLKNLSDAQELVLSLSYTSINVGDYAIPFDYMSGKFTVSYSTEDIIGLLLENDVKGDSTLTVNIPSDQSKIATFSNQLITITFTDTTNGASGNVFTLVLDITVTMDIYDLAFKDGEAYSVTVTGAETGEQTADITVVYNNGALGVAPSIATVKSQNVVGIYVKENGDYKEIETSDTSDIYVSKSVSELGDSVSYTLHVKNGIDRGVQYYVGLDYSDNVSRVPANHFRKVTINTRTSHVEFASGNVSLEEVEGELVANEIVYDGHTTFRLVANVVNDGSNTVESGKTASYELYSDPDHKNKLGSDAAVTISNSGLITVNPDAISGTVYYKASYSDEYSKETCKYAVFKYRVAPSKVEIDLTSVLFNSTSKTITLYYGGEGNYTSVNLTGAIITSNAFGVAYGADDVKTISVALKNPTKDSSYVNISGLTVSAKGVNNNAETNVVIVISATYADKTVTNEYTVKIVPIQALSLSGKGEISLMKNNDSVTVTPTIGAYVGLTPTYTLSDTTGMFTVSGEGNVKTVTLASAAKPVKGTTYNLTATLTYSLNAGSNFTAMGNYESTKQYSIKAVGDYTPSFKLVKVVGTEEVEIPVDSEYHIDGDASNTQYRIVITGDDSEFSATYSATHAYGVVDSIGSFTNKKADITFNTNASGAFSITVIATVRDNEYTCPQNYNFTYGIKAVGTLYVSANNADYTKFTADEQNIDYTLTPYTFKYVVSGIPSTATVNIVVNGDVVKGELQSDSDNNQFIIITAQKTTTMLIGGYVTVGSRTIYLADKKVELKATQPDFELGCGANTSVMPTKTLQFGISAATNFAGDYTVEYTTESAYASINKTSGVLTANANVITDQSVIVRATIKVTSGVYTDETYVLEKTVTVKGVALPEVKWLSSAKNNIGIGTTTYSSSNAYTLEKNGFAGYTADYSVSVRSSTLTVNTDYSIDESTGELTINDTDNTRAGGSITLRVTAKITCDTHKDEEVYDEITVLVIPAMSTTTETITLGNVKNTYDLNGEYKSVFAPVGLTVSDYAIVGLSVKEVGVEQTTNFGVDGAKLVVKNNITTDTQVEVTATVLITAGKYNGATVTGKKTVTIAASQATENTFTWNSTNNAYNTFALDKSKTIGADIEGSTTNVSSIEVSTTAPFVSVTNNGSASPVISVDKAAAAYLGTTAPNVTFEVIYTVTLENGNVYSATVTHTVNAVKVGVSIVSGSDLTAINSITLNSSETALLRIVADNGFDVNADSVSKTANGSSSSNTLTVEYGGNRLQLTASEVTSQQSFTVTVNYTVAGKTGSIELAVTINAPQTGAAYNATNTSALYKLNENAGSVVLSSEWKRNSSSYYYYAGSITVTASNGKNLSTYLTALSITASNLYDATSLNTESDLKKTSVTLYFYSDRSRYDMRKDSAKFNLNMTFKTNAVTSATITARLTAYYSSGNTIGGGGSTPVTVQYNVRVINTVKVNLIANAGSDAVTGYISNITPQFKSTYSALPDLTRVGYVFGGWHTSVSDDSEIKKTDTVDTPDEHTLYAHWTARKYTVKYDGNYSDAPSIDQETDEVTYGGTYGTLNSTTTRNGYTFVGWYDAADGGNAITADTVVKPANDTASDITLYAHWSKDYYTVTLNANGGTIGGAATLETQVAYEGTYSLHTVIKPTYTGNTFIGWYDAEEGGEKVTGTQTITADLPLYAHWEAQYTVSFNLNYEGATGAPESKLYDKNQAYGTLPEVSRDGYKFDGWYNGDSKVTSTQTVTASIPLYAHWIEQYTVSFDLNYEGDTGTPASVTYDEGDTYGTLPVVSREGYTFDGWHTHPTNDSNVTSTQSVTATVTLYAHWTQLFTVTLNANGGTIGGAATLETQVAYGGSYNLHTVIKPTYTGNTFIGWYDAEEGGEKVTGTQTITADLPLYAHWEAQYTVSFNLNYEGATGAPESKLYDKNQAYGTLPVVSRDGYKFDGWYNGDSKVTSTQTVTASIPLYAHWIEQYTVSFDLNYEGATGAPESKLYDENQAYGTLPEVSRDGYKFDGWYNGDSKVTSTQKVTASIPLYAHWIEQYTVSFNLNYEGATGAPESKLYDENQAYGTLPEVSRDGYKFDGWYNGDSKVTSTQKVTASIPLDAHWKQLFTVNFDLNYDGAPTGLSYSKIYADGDTYGTLPEVSREGYTFDGWHTHPTNNSKVETTQTVTATATLYAHWTQTKFTVTLLANGGMFEDGKSVLTYYVDKNSELSLPIQDKDIFLTDKLDGYIFDGWFLDGEKQGNKITVTADITLIAQWKQPYVVVFFNYNNDENDPIIESAIYSQDSRYDSNEKFTTEPGSEGNMRFVGWSTNKDAASEDECVHGDNLVPNNGVTLYAVYVSDEP